jgi:hypothetical protein
MKLTAYTVATIAGCSLLIFSPLKAAPVDEQTAHVRKIEDQIDKLKKLPPEELDKGLQMLEIEDPSIAKAVAKHRALAKEKEAALTLLEKAHASVLENTLATLAIEKRKLEELKASK